MSIIKKIKYNLSPRGFIENLAKNTAGVFHASKFVVNSFKKEFQK